MSCFWQGLCSKVPALRKHRPHSVIKALQSVNCLTKDVLWDGHPLTAKAMEENMEWIKDYNPMAFGGGHQTSICDPFLLLVTQVFAVNITHAYTGYSHKENPKAPRQVTTTHK